MFRWRINLFLKFCTVIVPWLTEKFTLGLVFVFLNLLHLPSFGDLPPHFCCLYSNELQAQNPTTSQITEMEILGQSYSPRNWSLGWRHSGIEGSRKWVLRAGLSIHLIEIPRDARFLDWSLDNVTYPINYSVYCSISVSLSPSPFLLPSFLSIHLPIIFFSLLCFFLWVCHNCFVVAQN